MFHRNCSQIRCSSVNYSTATSFNFITRNTRCARLYTRVACFARYWRRQRFPARTGTRILRHNDAGEVLLPISSRSSPFAPFRPPLSLRYDPRFRPRSDSEPTIKLLLKSKLGCLHFNYPTLRPCHYQYLHDLVAEEPCLPHCVQSYLRVGNYQNTIQWDFCQSGIATGNCRRSRLCRSFAISSL